MENTGIYIHIPFCKSKCIYCDFYSVPHGEDLMEDYLRALICEIRLRGSRSFTVDTVYIGGGTPSHFGYERLMEILRAVRESFSLSANCEITFEANPESITFDGLTLMRKIGFNRISIGVQSFLDTDLKNLRRAHTALRAENAVQTAAEAGFDNVSIDLIFGLPGQSIDAWRENLRKALTLPISHISCYGLIPEEGTPLVSSPLMATLPDDDMQADMYLEAVSFLGEHGFEQYEISNFSKGGRISRHNMRYWRLQPYIGLGAAAHSDFDDIRSANAGSVEAYIKAINEQGTAVEAQEPISPGERRRERIMLGLRTTDGIEAGWFEDGEAFSRIAEKYVCHGLGIFENGRFRLTAPGFMVSNGIINEFLDLLPGNVTTL